MSYVIELKVMEQKYEDSRRELALQAIEGHSHCIGCGALVKLTYKGKLMTWWGYEDHECQPFRL